MDMGQALGTGSLYCAGGRRPQAKDRCLPETHVQGCTVAEAEAPQKPESLEVHGGF